MVVDKLLDLGKKWFKIRITKKKKRKVYQNTGVSTKI